MYSPHFAQGLHTQANVITGYVVLDRDKLVFMIGSYCRNRPMAIRTYGKIGTWDVTSVTNMDNVFAGRDSFNESIEAWDVSKVTSMAGMFAGCTSFNQPLEKWNVARVTDMNNMFASCELFNQPLDGWMLNRNGTVVTNCQRMFYGCKWFLRTMPQWRWDLLQNRNEIFGECTEINDFLNQYTTDQALQDGCNIVSEISHDNLYILSFYLRPNQLSNRLFAISTSHSAIHFEWETDAATNKQIPVFDTITVPPNVMYERFTLSTPGTTSCTRPANQERAVDMMFQSMINDPNVTIVELARAALKMFPESRPPKERDYYDELATVQRRSTLRSNLSNERQRTKRLQGSYEYVQRMREKRARLLDPLNEQELADLDLAILELPDLDEDDGAEPEVTDPALLRRDDPISKREHAREEARKSEDDVLWPSRRRFKVIRRHLPRLANIRPWSVREHVRVFLGGEPCLNTEYCLDPQDIRSNKYRRLLLTCPAPPGQVWMTDLFDMLGTDSLQAEDVLYVCAKLGFARLTMLNNGCSSFLDTTNHRFLDALEDVERLEDQVDLVKRARQLGGNKKKYSRRHRDRKGKRKGKVRLTRKERKELGH